MYSTLQVCCFFVCLCTVRSQNACDTGDYYWRDFHFGTIPHDAIEIADDGKYIAQVYVEGGVVPATIYPHFGYAVAELYKKVLVKENIKILCAPDKRKFYWEPVDFSKQADDQMKNSLVGGFFKTYTTVLVGKTYHEGEWKVGKVINMDSALKGLRIWDINGITVTLLKFRMLKCKIAVINDSVC